MGYETLVLEVGGYKLEFSHNDSGTKVSIIAQDGLRRFVMLSHRQAKQIEQHLHTTLPYMHGVDR